MSGKRIFIVDDDPKIGELFATVLRRDGYEASSYVSPVAMLELIDSGSVPDLILTDLMMPEMSGIEMIGEVRRRELTLPIIVMTAHSSVQTAVEAMRLGAFHYLQKPVNLEEMRALLTKALDLYSDKKELKEIKTAQKKAHDVSKILGKSDEIEAVRQTIETLKDIPNTIVLIRGETGTGKNLAAKTIHFSSRWNAGRFVEINCAALPDNLLESELFGYEKGAFTDARASKPGLLEVADGGTLFLDEIDSMSVPLQAKLLSFLESRTFRRLGGVDDIRVSTRIVCATNADLEQSVTEKKFRKDLFFRINVVSIKLPALRQMGRDLLVIARDIVKHFNREFNKQIDGFTPEAEEKLVAHDWPGNVRELRNVLERAMIFARGARLDAGDLVLLRTEEFATEPADGYFRFRSGGTLEDLEHQYIRHILQTNKLSYAETSKLLGISKKTLWEKRKKYQLDDGVEEEEAG
jgi:two-component system, NtrC family, response regulator AtoC